MMRNREKKKRRTQELTTWGLQDTRLTELRMREVLIKKPKKHDCRYNSKALSTQLQRQGTKLPSLSSSLACIGWNIIKIQKIQDLERNTVHTHQSIKHMYDQRLTLLTYCNTNSVKNHILQLCSLLLNVSSLHVSAAQKVVTTAE